jgi:hypothetical protein
VRPTPLREEYTQTEVLETGLLEWLRRRAATVVLRLTERVPLPARRTRRDKKKPPYNNGPCDPDEQQGRHVGK